MAVKLKRGVSFLGERKYFSGACKTILLRGFFYYFKTTLLLFFSTNAYDFLCCWCFLCSEGTSAEYQKPNTPSPPVLGCEGVGLIIFFTLLNVRNYGMVLLTFVFCDYICSPFLFSQSAQSLRFSYINNLGFLGLFQFFGLFCSKHFFFGYLASLVRMWI